jgi:tRNA-dihydrouridine synthase 3
LSVEYLKKVDPESVKFLYPRGWSDPSSKSGGRGGVVVPEEMDEEAMMNAMDSAETSAFAGNSTATAQPEAGMTGAEEGKDDVPLRPVEKRRLEWRGKTYLAPLTTVGNLVSPGWKHQTRWFRWKS